MEINFWNERWKQNQTGFHQNSVNPHLVTHWSFIAKGQGGVFVPLCGKSMDLLWLLQQGHEVKGVECSDLAINSFLSENNITSSKYTNEDFTVSQYDSLSLFQGDYFDLNCSHLVDVKYVFDRAALIALPEVMRLPYVKHMGQLIGEGSRILLITLEYDQSNMQGPPFSVDENEVCRLYSDEFSIEKLHQQDIIQNEDRFKAMGLESLIETVYCLQKL